MNNTINIWKPVGFTPLELVNKFKEKYPEHKDETVSYAGRLDPMAEGILVLLIGSENINRNKYLDLKKEYESEIIFGISTDTFDGLGLITDVKFRKISQNEIEKILNTFLGKQKQIYPPYSTKAVKGKSLYWWARNKRLGEIEIPERDIEIYSINLIEIKKISGHDLVKHVVTNIKKINGDFRQDEIVNGWEEFAKNYNEKSFTKIKIEISCSSGTYIRRIASDLGEKLKTGAFTFSIKRTIIGDIVEKDCLKV